MGRGRTIKIRSLANAKSMGRKNYLDCTAVFFFFCIALFVNVLDVLFFGWCMAMGIVRYNLP